MAKLAAKERPGWTASRVELDREGRSYTYDTLIELREALSETPGSTGTAAEGQIFFIIGADAFAEIA